MSRLLGEAWPDAFRIARTILQDPADAEDAAQEACARALNAADSLRNPNAFRSWFYRIVVNEARSRLRQRRKLMSTDEPSAPFDSPDDRIDVRRAIDRLDEPGRLVILLFYYAGLSTAEIATVVSASPVAVRLRLVAARRRLHRLLALDEVSSLPERTGHEPQTAK